MLAAAYPGRHPGEDVMSSRWQEGDHVIPRGLLYLCSAHTGEDLEVTRATVWKAAVAAADQGD
jgi:hypothetical protein